MILVGDVIEQLRGMDAESAQTVITSPPYWGLRDYGVEGMIGLEPTPGEHIARLVDVFREVRRVLRNDGTLWLNYGDGYVSQAGQRKYGSSDGATGRGAAPGPRLSGFDLAPKQRLLMPARVALALQGDGWWVRSEIVWAKPNPMPASVRDRPTDAHEMIYLLTKRPRYYYDLDAVRVAYAASTLPQLGATYTGQATKDYAAGLAEDPSDVKRRTIASMARKGGANRRTVWTIPTQPYKGAHFATFPEALVEPCVLAGSRRGDIVLDPFAGSGTVGVVALRHGREFVGIELNSEYAGLAEQRIAAEEAALSFPLGFNGKRFTVDGEPTTQKAIRAMLRERGVPGRRVRMLLDEARKK